MTRYTYAQLEGLWEEAGGSHALAPVMAAIAEAESGGDPNATGGLGEKGLWQIYPKVWGGWATYDPLGNARAAVHVYDVQGLTAWSTYNSGAYRAFLSSKTTPVPPNTGGHGAGHPLPAPGTPSTGGGPGVVPPDVGVGLTGTAGGGVGGGADDCAWEINWLKGSGLVLDLLNPVAGLITDVSGAGQVCLLHKSQVRAVLSALIIVAGTGITLFGVGFLLSNTSIGQAALRTARRGAAVVGA